jgi:hypothetical protein
LNNHFGDESLALVNRSIHPNSFLFGRERDLRVIDSIVKTGGPLSAKMKCGERIG